MNRVELIGNIGTDTTVKDVGEGRKTANVSLATHHRWRDKDGNRHKDTQWHPVIFWGRQAELAERLLRKGQLVYIAGRLKYSRWTDDEDRIHYRTELVGHTFLVLSPRSVPTADEAPSSEQGVPAANDAA